MKTLSILLLSCFLVVTLYHFSWPRYSTVLRQRSSGHFLQCLSRHSQNFSAISSLTYTPESDSYLSILQLTLENLRFSSPSTPKPLAIITPLYEFQIQPVIYCSERLGLEIRIRSGGHDYEGLSYRAEVPFVILDLLNLTSVDVDIAGGTAWVQSGAKIGQLYSKIAEKNRTLGFPAAVCLAVGFGGYLSGGGYGMMLRKYGLAADNVIDARLIDVNGTLLDRESMGEDLFWAIRGGGGGSFGVVVAWKLKLVPVPENVTIFRVQRTLEQNATQLIHRWQSVAPRFHEDLFVGISIDKLTSNESGGNTTIRAAFFSLFLGGVDRLIPLMQESFPELGLVKEDCTEMSWLEAVTVFGGNAPPRSYFKGKSDYVQKPIPIKAIEGISRFILNEEAIGRLLLIPYGGKMAEISESALPFPHRAGNLFKIHYAVYWDEEGTTESKRHITWIRKLYKFMTPYVSKCPREAYINYRDLDLGVNEIDNTNYEQASKWGKKYFKSNFERLTQIKTMVDPTNFFRHEQSIPPLWPPALEEDGQLDREDTTYSILNMQKMVDGVWNILRAA